jgi:hypothetical protein
MIKILPKLPIRIIFLGFTSVFKPNETSLTAGKAVLRIRDVYPVFRIPDLGFRISDPGSKNSNKRER